MFDKIIQFVFSPFGGLFFNLRLSMSEDTGVGVDYGAPIPNQLLDPEEGEYVATLAPSVFADANDAFMPSITFFCQRDGFADVGAKYWPREGLRIAGRQRFEDLCSMAGLNLSGIVGFEALVKAVNLHFAGATATIKVEVALDKAGDPILLTRGPRSGKPALNGTILSVQCKAATPSAPSSDYSRLPKSAMVPTVLHGLEIAVLTDEQLEFMHSIVTVPAWKQALHAEMLKRTSPAGGSLAEDLSSLDVVDEAGNNLDVPF